MLANISPGSATTVDVTDQAGFDAAIQAAITTGQPNTIDVNAPSPISADTGLVLPGQASPLNLNFGLAPVFGVGNGSIGNLTIGAGTNLTFTPTTSYALFRVGHGAGASGTITMTGGTITGNQSLVNYVSFSVGNSLGMGTFNQSGGTFNLEGGAFQLGIASGQGTYNLSGTGVVNVGTGGTVYLGDSVGGVGNLNVSGGASFTSGGQMFVGNAGAAGAITQNGLGSLVVLNEGNSFGTSSAGGTGTYNLDNGSLQIADASFASFGTIAGASGIFNQSGGTFTTAGTGVILIGDSGTGIYNLSGGTATLADGLTVGESAGSTGTVNQTGGLVTISGGVLTVGLAGAGTYNLNGGVLQAGGANSITGTGSLNLGGGTLQIINSALTTNIAIALTGTNSTVDTNGFGAAFGGAMSGTGGFTKSGAGTLTLTGADIYTGATTISGGTLQIGNGGTTGSIVGNVIDNATLVFDRSNAAAFGGAISGTGGVAKMSAGVLTLSGSSTYGGPTSVTVGTLQGGAVNALSPSSAFMVATGATLDLNSFNQTIGSLAGAGGVTLGSATLATGNDGTGTTFSGDISGLGGLTKIGGGTFVLSGLNSYFGATAISGGTLEVDGAIANTSGVTVNSGGTLSGTGIVDPSTTTIMNGGRLAPGNASNPTGTLTVTGNLAFQSGAVYLVQVSPTAASTTNVSGIATLGGATVSAVFGTGNYVARKYTILTASGGVSGAFASTVITNSAALQSSLSYDANDAYLSIALNYSAPGGLNDNQRAVGNALTNAFNAAGGLQSIYASLTPAGLTQASGELATGSQQTTFDAMGQFMGLLTDPFMNRRGGAGSASGATGYADEAGAYAASRKTDAFAMFTKAPPAPFAQRWSVWASGFGGSQTTDGNAAVGSNTTSSQFYGTAVGADYLFSPDTVAGFALAGGGTNFSLANSGSGHSDLFQAGAYVRHTDGPAYISAALAYGWQDITTNRTVTIAGIDQLRAEFNANAYSGRLEAGYRFVAPWTGGVGITPYAAGQLTTFDLPAYAEGAVTGTPNFALAYAAKEVTDTRSELGIRADKSFFVPDGVLTLFSRFAWAHDFDPDRSVAATFQALPGASFVVNGAAPASDSALTTASIEMKWKNGWSAAATFEGEFSAVTTSYAGKGVVRYIW